MNTFSFLTDFLRIGSQDATQKWQIVITILAQIRYVTSFINFFQVKQIKFKNYDRQNLLKSNSYYKYR